MEDDLGFRDLPAEMAESAVRQESLKRLDFFAGCALAGLLSGAMGLKPEDTEPETLSYDWACSKAYDVAKMMVKEREGRIE